MSFECPVARSYCEPLAELARSFPDAAFVGVCCEAETATELARYVSEFKIPFPLLHDPKHAAAEALQATTTPEAFLLDSDFILRYRGRIDNAYSARLKKKAETTSHDLRRAIEELLAGKPITQPTTKAVGCPISRRTESQSVNEAVTYYRDVLPVLQENCQQCHRPGEVAPFSLMNYRQAVNWAQDIKEYTQNRKMPPWKPVEGPGFHNERRLSQAQLGTLAAWVDGGTPEGNTKDAPPPRQFTKNWQLGQPDLVLTLSDDFQLGATGKDVFRCFVLPTHLAEDKYVTAVEVRPGNPRIVHHALLAIDTRGEGHKLEEAERQKQKPTDLGSAGPGYSVAMGFGFLPQGSLSGWAPGQRARYLPEGTGYFLPKGADVVMQVHYHRDGRPEKDRTTVGLYFAQKPVERRLQGLTLPGTFLRIPAGDSHFRVEGRRWVDHDCVIYTVLPHMHMLGREIKVTLTPPDGPPQTLVAIKDWDYHWQETYVFREPIHVKAGTRFDVAAYYDNSAENPHNPNTPPQIVRFGQQTTDEMCFIFFGATADQPVRVRFQRQAPKPKGSAAGEH
jgi:hypothetical protein